MLHEQQHGMSQANFDHPEGDHPEIADAIDSRFRRPRRRETLNENNRPAISPALSNNGECENWEDHAATYIVGPLPDVPR
jgi:hypothetical protein